MSGNAKRLLSSAEESAAKHGNSDFQREILAGIGGVNSANCENRTRSGVQSTANRPRSTRPIGNSSQSMTNPVTTTAIAAQPTINRTRSGDPSQAIVDAGQSRTNPVTTSVTAPQPTSKRSPANTIANSSLAAQSTTSANNASEPSIVAIFNCIQ